jgi:CBS domain-containing protein
LPIPSIRLLRDQKGATTTEYAIIMALVAAAVMLGSDALRFAADSSFRRSALALGDVPAAASGGAAASNAATEGPAVAAVAAVLPPVHAFAWGVLVAAVGIVGHSRYRRMRAKRAVQDIECQADHVVEAPSNPNFKKRQEIQRVLLRHFDDVLHSRIEARHVMSRKVRSVDPMTPVSDLKTLMETEGFHHLLVMREGKLLGIISDRDIFSRSGKRASNIMTANPQTVTPGTRLTQVITLTLHRRISCLPVVEDGQVKGILTTTDMLMSLQCLMQLLERAQGDGGSGVIAPTGIPEMAAAAPVVC